MSIFRKTATVEEIHAEFDSAEAKILENADMIIEGITHQVSETREEVSNSFKDEHSLKVKNKADKLRSLGFDNAGAVREVKTFEEDQRKMYKRIEDLNKKMGLSDTIAKSIRELKQHYPLDKFITIEELNRICTKYKLVHAPVTNYVKDVPEKNVLEMMNRKPLESRFKIPSQYKHTVKGKFWSDVPSSLRKQLRKGVVLDRPIRDEKKLSQAVGNGGDYLWGAEGDLIIENTNKDGLHIAAPKSHFNLKGLKKVSKFGFASVTKEVIKIEDPVVFEYCKNDIVRIVTKWGTPDDQSYLDPALTNETLN